jgi:hypothetical protein
MPRPKSELTNSKKAIGVRLTEWEYQEWIRLGSTKWLRQLLMDSKRKALADVQKSKAS